MDTNSSKKRYENILVQKKAYIYASLENKNIANNQTTDDKESVVLHENMMNSKDWAVVSGTEDNKLKIYETGIDYSIIRLYLMRFRGLALYVMNESYFTDYQLPIVVAIIAILLGILI